MMKVISTNLGERKKIQWNNKELETGIYKHPVKDPIFLGFKGVQNDQVVNTKVHGGIDKACYLYSELHYDFWKQKYPHLDWNWGMFGENLTVSELNEKEVMIGDIYEIGEAHVQVSQPRQPCFKLGIRFGDQNIIKEFVKAGFPGVYVRVIKEGWVKQDDVMNILMRSKNSLSVQEINYIFYDKEVHKEKIELAIFDGNLSQSLKNELMKKLN